MEASRRDGYRPHELAPSPLSATITMKPPMNFVDLLGDGPKTVRESEWLVIPQGDIDAFGQLTRDPDPNHIDPAWARAHSPFGGPIAFGFQTLSMLTWLIKSAGATPVDAVHVVNYGFDRVRFVSPVHAGSAIQGRFTIESVTLRSPVQAQVRYGVEVVARDATKPVLVAQWLALFERAAPA